MPSATHFHASGESVSNFVQLNSSVNNLAQQQTIQSGGEQGTADQDVSFFNFGGGFFGTTAFLLGGNSDASAGWGGVGSFTFPLLTTCRKTHRSAITLNTTIQPTDSTHSSGHV